MNESDLSAAVGIAKPYLQGGPLPTGGAVFLISRIIVAMKCQLARTIPREDLEMYVLPDKPVIW